jgi:hypothetical protein
VLKPARDVTVSVVDARGAAVEGAAVCLLDLVFPMAEARTDAHGIARLRVPADAWTQWIFGSKPGVGFDYYENYKSMPPINWAPPPDHARIVLDGTRTVRVRAIDTAGKPVPGLEISPWEVRKKGKLNAVNLAAFPIKVLTDEQGVATFDWLPADIQEGTRFLLHSPTYDMPNGPLLDPGKPGAELTARVRRFTQVTGTVTQPDGSPASGIVVEAQGVGATSPGSSSFGRVKTAATGSYVMDLPPEQSYMISVVDNE